jgi:hypothetical protein
MYNFHGTGSFEMYRATIGNYIFKTNVISVPKHHAMKTYGGVEYSSKHLEPRYYMEMWSVSSSGCFTPGARAPSTERIGGWVDTRAGLDMVAKRKIPASIRNQTPLVQSVTSYFIV